MTFGGDPWDILCLAEHDDTCTRLTLLAGEGSSQWCRGVNISPAAYEHHLGPKQYLRMLFLTHGLSRENAVRYNQLHMLLPPSINQAGSQRQSLSQHGHDMKHDDGTVSPLRGRLRASRFFTQNGKGRLISLLLLLQWIRPCYSNSLYNAAASKPKAQQPSIMFSNLGL